MPLNTTRGAGSATGFGFTTAGVKPVDFDYLVIAGGGAGTHALGGGSGGGGMRSSFPGGTKVTIKKVNTPITVGAGGSAITPPTTGPTLAAAHGNDSSIGTSIISAGGGYWNSTQYDPSTPNTNPTNAAARDGGSGAGQTHQSQTNTGLGNVPPTSPPQGFPGGPGGGSFGASGGGGAGGAGNNGTTPGNPTNNSGPGGPGAANSISGTPVTYAGGGGGGQYGGTAGAGGPGGGGAGGNGSAPGQAGQVNTGGGGGGPAAASSTGCGGGSGIVYLRIPAANAPATLAVAPGTNTLTTDGPTGDKICTFTVSGTLTI